MTHFNFLPHGDFNVEISGRIIQASFTGPWNEELTDLYKKNVVKHVEALAGRPWGLLAKIKKEGLHTPASYSATLEVVRAHRQQGRVASAIVLQDVMASQIVQSVFSKLYREAGEPHAFFEDEESARNWLSDRLDKAVADGDGRGRND